MLSTGVVRSSERDERFSLTLRMLLLVHAKRPLFNDVTVYEFLSITWFSREVEPFKTTTTF